MPGGWFYNDVSGVVRYDSGPAYFADILARDLGTGWHGPYKTEALADTHKGTIGAKAINTDNPFSAAGNAVQNAAQNAIPGAAGLVDIGKFFHNLTEKSTWTRVGEVALGGILLYAGIRALTHGSPTVGSGARKTATRPVKKVTRAAVTIAAPEARLASRTLAKKAAPKTTARVAAHRETVRKYGAKQPYRPPPPRQPTVRISHIHHHKAPVKKGPVKK